MLHRSCHISLPPCSHVEAGETSGFLVQDLLGRDLNIGRRWCVGSSTAIVLRDLLLFDFSSTRTSRGFGSNEAIR